MQLLQVYNIPELGWQVNNIYRKNAFANFVTVLDKSGQSQFVEEFVLPYTELAEAGDQRASIASISSPDVDVPFIEGNEITLTNSQIPRENRASACSLKVLVPLAVPSSAQFKDKKIVYILAVSVCDKKKTEFFVVKRFRLQYNSSCTMLQPILIT